ncbi:MAG: DNA replication/repair protein RecF [Clostridia bacterium]|nr:DNA replication/repair protein RecF [Clostridia bacterium]
MTVSKVTYQNWRNIEQCEVQLRPGINVLWGNNAQGKSNILEGIYYFARGRSFRGAKDRELIRFGESFANAAIDFRKDGYTGDTRLMASIPLSGKKKLYRNGAALSSAAEMMGSFRAVLFCPSNLTIVTGGPAERRTFLDIAISQLSGAYLTWLRRYTKILTERNALIKRAKDGERVTVEEWAVYAEGLSECGAWIAAYRNEYVKMLSDAVGRYFQGMTGGREVPAMEYTSHALYDGIPMPLTSADVPDRTILCEKLMNNVEREVAAGVTLWGIHKDDVVLSLNGREARLYGSQGQQRSIVLSMKLAEAEIANRIGGEYPVILLDDVFSELDDSRRSYILDTLGSEGDNTRQIIITSCEPDVIPGHRAAYVCFNRVAEGGIHNEKSTFAPSDSGEVM